LISAVFKQKSMPGVTVLLVERRGGLLKPLATERQLFEVVARPHFDALIDPDTRAWVKKQMAHAELVTITERIAACRDPTDDKFLELAVNGHADLIVTDDADLLALNPFRDIPIVTPAAFVQGAARDHDAADRKSTPMKSDAFRLQCPRRGTVDIKRERHRMRPRMVVPRSE
jgi:predicted nucleic acid-binding protein